MNRFTRALVATTIALSMASPALARSDEGRPSRRSILDAAYQSSKVEGRVPTSKRTRKPAEEVITGRTHLQRGEREEIADPKLEGGRYRRLMKPNTRNLRKAADLPESLVETGPRHPGRVSQQERHRPSRRSILEEAYDRGRN